MLRCTFEKRGNLRQLAKEYKSNHTQVRKTIECLAGLYVHLQHDAADREFTEAGQHDWLVMHLQWVGAKFTFSLNDGPPMVHEVLAQHAIARWRTKNGEEKWQELLLPPTAVDSTSADTTASALLVSPDGA